MYSIDPSTLYLHAVLLSLCFPLLWREHVKNFMDEVLFPSVFLFNVKCLKLSILLMYL